MFSKICAENFFSWSDLEFQFNTGVTLISGKNLDDGTDEGAGKSSIPNALCWGLYGTLPKDLNTDDVIKTGNKSCKVMIYLNDGHVIERSRKPNDLCIWKPYASEPTKGKDSRETQQLINKLVGMSFDTFCQSVYFAQNYNNKFITATQEDKAKILSELQDLGIFDRASKKAIDLLKQYKMTDLQTLQSSKSHKAQMKALIESEFNTFCNLSSNYDADKLKELDEIIARNNEIEDKASQLEVELNQITGLDELSAKSNRLEELEFQIANHNSHLYHIDMLKAQKHEMETNKTCPTCSQTIDGKTCELDIPDITQVLKEKIELEQEANKLQKSVQDLLAKTQKNILLTEKLKNLREQRKQISHEITKIESSHNPYLDKISELNTKLEAVKSELVSVDTELETLLTKIQHLEFLKTGFKEIKSFVFTSLLQELNSKTNKYLRDLFEVPAYITFDNISDEGEISKIKTSVMLDGNERSLGLLSGGQFRRVQLAVDFALSEIISNRSHNPISLRILDEAFKDLSESSMEKVVNILQSMKGSTIVIEHNSIVKSIVNRVYHIELNNGESTHVTS